MPHYADGTEAKPGDVVIGRGYNIKDEDGNLKEISGIVHHVTPGVSSCNVQILLLRPLEHADRMHLLRGSKVPQNLANLHGQLYLTELEYGQCDHFRPVDSLVSILPWHREPPDAAA